MKTIEVVATVKVFAIVESDNEDMDPLHAEQAAQQAVQQKAEQLCGRTKEHVDGCGTCVVTIRQEPRVKDVRLAPR